VRADGGHGMRELEVLFAELKVALDAGDLDEARCVAKRLADLAGAELCKRSALHLAQTSNL
jgi:hypothetical protein